MEPPALLAARLITLCIIAANVTAYVPLPGAVGGYLVEVTAPAGSHVVLYPSAGAPPVPVPQAGIDGDCAVYRAGPLPLGPGAYILVTAGNVTRRIMLDVPRASAGGVEASEAQKASQSSVGSSTAPVTATGAVHSNDSSMPVQRPGEGGDGWRLWVTAASIVLLLAVLAVHLPSSRSGSPPS